MCSGIKQIWPLIPILPITNCVIIGKLFNLSRPTYLIGKMGTIKIKLMHVKHVEQSI